MIFLVSLLLSAAIAVIFVHGADDDRGKKDDPEDDMFA